MEVVKGLSEILCMCYMISTESNYNAFFEYAPHCDAYDVRITDEQLKNTIYIDTVTKITMENINRTIEYLINFAAAHDIDLFEER